MRVKILRGVVGEGGETYEPGEVREVSASFGRWLIGRGKAEPAGEGAQARDPAATTRDPKPARGGKAK